MNNSSSNIKSLIGKNIDKFLEYTVNYCDGVNGKKILEVGCGGKGKLVQGLTQSYKPEEVIGIDLHCNYQKFSECCKIQSGDIRKTAFQDSYFDIIISNFTFEHVRDFDVAVDEMFRVLKIGGYLFSQFGPIWSAPHGHHLWYHHENVLYNYNNVILPPFSHLLLQPNEILKVLESKYEFIDEVNQGILEFIFKSESQNRLFYEDYKQIINQSKFTELFFKGISSENLQELYHKDVTPKIFEKLKSKYPKCSNFMHNGIMFLLKKD